jgi:hypothetical protein
MSVALDEDQCAVDDDLVYPNIMRCIALAVGSSGGSLCGMHLAVATSAAQLLKAGELMAPLLAGPVSSVVCIGDTGGFVHATDAAMRFPSPLRDTLKRAFQFTGNVQYHNTGPLYAATRGPNPNSSADGVVVTAYRDARTHALRYRVGPYTAAVKTGIGTVTSPYWKVVSRAGAVHVDALQNTPARIYTLVRGMADLPALGLGTM